MGARTGPVFHVIETVRCLGCEAVYAKPRLGGTAATNPGCPECGYLGWAPVLEVKETQRRAPHERRAVRRLPSVA